MACDYLGEFMEKMEEFGASCYNDWFLSGGIEKCEFLSNKGRQSQNTTIMR